MDDASTELDADRTDTSATRDSPERAEASAATEESTTEESTREASEASATAESTTEGSAALDPRLPSPVVPVITAPMAVDRPPEAGGSKALSRALEESLGKAGVRRGLQLLRTANAEGHTQCPGCAWPVGEAERRGESRAPTCEAGARVLADSLNPRRATAMFFASYTLVELSARSDHWLGAQGRLTEPLLHEAGEEGYAPISWDEAFALVGRELARLRDAGHGDRAVFYGSARSSNEAAFAYQLLARAAGSPHLPSSSNLCHDASALALREGLGLDLVQGTASVADLEGAALIVCIGHNPGTTHARMLQSLRRAKQRGAAIVAVNPMRESGLLRHRDLRERSDWFGPAPRLADAHLQVRVGGDRAVLEACIKVCFEKDAIDRAFVDARCEGLDALEAEIAGRSWSELEAASGVPEAQLRSLGERYAAAKSAVFTWGTGLVQQPDAGATVSTLLSLLALRGNLPGGREHAGPMPLLGHHNVVGCKRAGLDHAPAAAFVEGLERRLGLRAPDPSAGHSSLEAVDAMHRGEVEVLFNLGGNLQAAAPDSHRCAEAIRQTKLSVHLSTSLNRGHLITGERTLILPCLGRSERDPAGPVSADDLDGHRRLSTGLVAPIASTLRAEVDILCSIGAAMDDAASSASGLDWSALASDYAGLREHIDALSPRADASPSAPARTLSLAPPPRPEPDAPLADDELWMTTIRSHDQHNSTLFGKGDRLRGIRGYRRLVFVSLADLERLELEPYEQVDLRSDYAGRTRFTPRWILVPFDLPAGCCATYYPEGNVLVPLEARDPSTGAPASKRVRVRVARSAPLPERKPLKRLRR
ncbi:oxidoreductase alpha (molybdopterin) subunit [Plesiocystis pacifica SIR-1]|uniref:Oxidoreductase alpha (Molybdopterin) subunit n=1 Tax=Plesiocystis pacifica SIR-1 TaxID=391625 RepID=A6FWU2_9BACT|nr:molybdopterin-dependent oxidoreductase [Plesiocystis pacifica]EDM81766.1 oxidoreductase alpha (molybdopterin) subunit [Plesiocystis pacifica SIR-1]